MTRFAVTLAAAAAAIATPAAAEPFDWLTGRWCTADPGPTRTCEAWGGWWNGRIAGKGWTLRSDRVVEAEATLIRLEAGNAVYEATPAGAGTTRFVEAARGRRAIAFANPAHDYPQRIRYWREGADLLAEISLADGSKAKRWRYRRAPAGAGDPR